MFWLFDIWILWFFDIIKKLIVWLFDYLILSLKGNVDSPIFDILIIWSFQNYAVSILNTFLIVSKNQSLKSVKESKYQSIKKMMVSEYQSIKIFDSIKESKYQKYQRINRWRIFYFLIFWHFDSLTPSKILMLWFFDSLILYLKGNFDSPIFDTLILWNF